VTAGDPLEASQAALNEIAAAGKRTRTGRRSQTRTTGARVFRDHRCQLADVGADVTKPARGG